MKYVCTICGYIYDDEKENVIYQIHGNDLCVVLRNQILKN